MSLIAAYRGLVCDLDGVVYRGEGAVEHAVEVLGAVDVPVLFATNNASRPPQEVSEHLRRLGLPVRPEEVITSSQAAAARVAEQVEPGSRVLAVGGEGVAVALREHGLDPVLPTAPDRGGLTAVVQGYGRAVTAGDLAEAAYAIQQGAFWVATNDDLTIPTEHGIAPGNGSLVQAVRRAVDQDPVVVGKPHPPLYLLAAQRTGQEPSRLLAVGDRLNTDIAGAVAAGMDSVLVLTGVDDPSTLAAADREQRPTYVLRDLRGLHEPYADARPEDHWFVCADQRLCVRDGRWADGSSPCPSDEEPWLQWVRAAVAAVHAARDAGELDPEQGRELMATTVTARA